MKKYCGYTRVSTVKQGEKGVSLQEQKSAISNYAQRSGLDITEWFEERVTAAKRGRPVFNRMMKLLRLSKADGVIIHKIDRSARNLKDWADLGELIDRGIEVHFANESLDLNSRGGRLSADIQAVVAADFIRNLKEETRKGFRGRIKQGLYPLPAPIGYLDMGKGKPKEPDPMKAPLVRKAFEIYATGRYNLDSLVQEMFELGLRNRNGNKVSMTGISIMLNNPFYTGIIKLKSTQETFQGAHAPIVRASLFNRVQAVLRGKTNTRVQKHDLLFRRMFACKHCGYSLIGSMHKGHVYYRCQNKGCPTTCVREDMIEAKVLRDLQSVQLSEREVAYLMHKVDRLRADWETTSSEQKMALELNLKQICDRLDRVTDAYIDRLIDKEVFEKRKESLLVEKAMLEEKLGEFGNPNVSVPEKMVKFLELVKSLYTSYKVGLPEEKRDFLKIVSSNRAVEGKNALFELNLPFKEVANRSTFSNGAPYRDRHRTLDKLFNRLVRYFKTEL